MTREEEIEQLLREIDNNYVDVTWAAKEAINWADQHPRKGLWDAQKVIEWLRNNAGTYLEDNRKYGEGCEYDISELIKDLRKAMEN